MNREAKQAVKVLENSLGSENDFTAMAVNNLARLYIHQGKYSEAEDLCRGALTTLENVFDENHPNVAEVLETMAHLHHRSGAVGKATKLRRRIEQIHASNQAAHRLVAKAIER